MITCTFPHGAHTGLRHLVVDGVVIDQENNLLLCRRAPHLTQGGKWALPGGYVERGETVFDAARREVLEETGYEATTIDFFALITDPERHDEGLQNCTAVFLVRPGEKTDIPDSESTEQKWFPLHDLPDAQEIAFDHLRIIELCIEHRYANNSGPVIF